MSKTLEQASCWAIVTCYRKEDNELINDREEIGELRLLSLGQNTVVG